MSYAQNFTVEELLIIIRHHLVLTTGKTEEEASDHEFYQAFSWALREEIMINWVATRKTMVEMGPKVLYYLSMEHLPGKLFSSNITNIGAVDLLKGVLAKTKRNLHDVLSCDPEPGLGNGGLGRLASCFLDSLATLNYPSIAFGLRYQYGIFEQEIWNNQQVERPDCWLLYQYPWEKRNDSQARNVRFLGKTIPATNSLGEEVLLLEDYQEVRALSFDIPIIGYSELPDYSVSTLRLWSTKESPRNFELQRYNAGQIGEAAENNSLTDVLYPNDNNDVGKRIRLKQEFLLVSASAQDIIHNHLWFHKDISTLANKVQIQINDTHPSLIIAEMMRILTKDYNLSWKKSLEMTQQMCNYTNHTVLREALEDWNEDRLHTLLPRQHQIIQKLNAQFCSEIRKKYPQDEEKVKRMSFISSGQIRMAQLAIYGSKKVNGVAKLHTEIVKEKLFKDFAEMFPDKFVNITNGVTQRRWVLHANPRLARFLFDRIGSSWLTDFSMIKKIADFAEDQKTLEEFLEIKKQNKEDLLEFLTHHNPLRDYKGRIIGHSPVLGSDALFDVHIKRFHEYKRQLMNALHVLILANEIQKDPSSRKIKRLVIFGGKAAPGYTTAKEIITLIHCIARYINNNNFVSEYLRVVMVENYNVTKAEIIIPAADLSEQISTAGMEASGTGNMKLSMNGALTIGTEDGANIEMRQEVGDEWWPFRFGSTREEIEALKKSSQYCPQDLYIQNPMIREALEPLKNGRLTRNEAEHTALTHLYEVLVDGHMRAPCDSFFVLHDLLAYYETQKKVEELYADPLKWAKFAIHNIAGMSGFSSDVSITNYVDKIWKLEKCPPRRDILQKVRMEHTENYHSDNDKPNP